MYNITYQKDKPVIKDAEKYDSSLHGLIERLRKRRIEECFAVINRGRLWYNRLSVEQYTELELWYDAWLNVTETLEIPAAPTWLNDKLEMEDIL